MIEDKTNDTPKVLLAAGGERGVIRVLDVNQKSQYTAVRSTIINGRYIFVNIASTNRCHQSYYFCENKTESSLYS